MVLRSGFFPDGLLTPKGHFGAIRANLKMVFLRKIHFFAYPFEPKKAIFDLLRGCFWPKTWKKLCIQFTQGWKINIKSTRTISGRKTKSY